MIILSIIFYSDWSLNIRISICLYLVFIMLYTEDFDVIYHDVEVKGEDIQWITHRMILRNLSHEFPMKRFYVNNPWVPHGIK